jgi:hypothetical protein
VNETVRDWFVRDDGGANVVIVVFGTAAAASTVKFEVALPALPAASVQVTVTLCGPGV